MNKIAINEATLTNIIAECVKGILKEINEIGDTEDGYNAIRNAEDKAFKNGRGQQARAFADYANEIDRKRFDSESIITATNKKITFMSATGARVQITRNGYVTDGDKPIVGQLGANGFNEVTSWMKTDSKSSARKIALWCSKFLLNPEVSQNMKNDITDWHTWARL